MATVYHLKTLNSLDLREDVPAFPCDVTKLVIIPRLGYQVVATVELTVQRLGHRNLPALWVNLMGKRVNTSSVSLLSRK